MQLLCCCSANGCELAWPRLEQCLHLSDWVTVLAVLSWTTNMRVHCRMLFFWGALLQTYITVV